MLVDSERLPSNGRLVDLEESIFGNNTAIGGNDGTLRIEKLDASKTC